MAARINEIVQECEKWEEVIRSKEDYLDRYAELDPDFLQYGKVRDAIVFTALGPEDYRYNPDVSTKLKDFPKDFDVARFYRTLDLLEDTRDDFAYDDEHKDHINTVLVFLHWAVGDYEEAVGTLFLIGKPTQLSLLTAQALFLGMPGYFAPSN